jgi:hypothetical protein
MNRIDAGYRSLVCAIILRAVRDVQEGRQAEDARAFLVSPECKRLALLASIRWTVDAGDIDQPSSVWERDAHDWAARESGKRLPRTRQVQASIL